VARSKQTLILNSLSEDRARENLNGRCLVAVPRAERRPERRLPLKTRAIIIRIVLLLLTDSFCAAKKNIQRRRNDTKSPPRRTCLFGSRLSFRISPQYRRNEQKNFIFAHVRSRLSLAKPPWPLCQGHFLFGAPPLPRFLVEIPISDNLHFLPNSWGLA
jgi:hypothetical protein